MTAEHSAAPWHRYGDGSGIANADGQPVAMVFREGATWEANACLIEQSPRLLKAAKDLWHANAAEGNYHDETLITDAWIELIDAVEAAAGSRP